MVGRNGSSGAVGWTRGGKCPENRGRSRTKTLHRVRECHRELDAHYKDFECHVDDLPKSSSYHWACRSCFPYEGGSVLGADDEVIGHRLRSGAESD